MGRVLGKGTHLLALDQLMYDQQDERPCALSHECHCDVLAGSRYTSIQP